MGNFRSNRLVTKFDTIVREQFKDQTMHDMVSRITRHLRKRSMAEGKKKEKDTTVRDRWATNR